MSKLPDQIKIMWHKDDVLGRAEALAIECTDLQARKILQLMSKNHDCNSGISWDTIDYYLETL